MTSEWDIPVMECWICKAKPPDISVDELRLSPTTAYRHKLEYICDYCWQKVNDACDAQIRDADLSSEDLV